MAINLGQQYRQRMEAKREEPPPPKKVIGKKTINFFKLSIVISAFIIAYIVLSSTIIEEEVERSMVFELYDTTVELSKKIKKEEQPILDEKLLVTEVDKELARNLSGKILLQVQESGEAWYVYPDDLKKYYLGRPGDAFKVMRRLGLGTTHNFITSYTSYPTKVLGKILLDVEQNGEAYYINPEDSQAYFLGRPDDAFQVMREQGLGITNEDIRKIEVGEIID